MSHPLSGSATNSDNPIPNLRGRERNSHLQKQPGKRDTEAWALLSFPTLHITHMLLRAMEIYPRNHWFQRAATTTQSYTSWPNLSSPGGGRKTLFTSFLLGKTLLPIKEIRYPTLFGKQNFSGRYYYPHYTWLHKSGAGKLWPKGHVWPTAYLGEQSLLYFPGALTGQKLSSCHRPSCPQALKGSVSGPSHKSFLTLVLCVTINF